MLKKPYGIIIAIKIVLKLITNLFWSVNKTHNLTRISEEKTLIMAQQKDEHVWLDARLWLACTMLGVLLCFMIVSFPGY